MCQIQTSALWSPVDAHQIRTARFITDASTDKPFDGFVFPGVDPAQNTARWQPCRLTLSKT